MIIIIIISMKIKIKIKIAIITTIICFRLEEKDWNYLLEILKKFNKKRNNNKITIMKIDLFGLIIKNKYFLNN